MLLLQAKNGTDPDPFTYLHVTLPGADVPLLLIYHYTLDYKKAQLFEQAMAITDLIPKFVKCKKL